MKKKDGPEIRLNADGSIDEVILKRPNLVHVEQMSEDYWWIGIYYGKRNEKRWTLHFYTGTGDTSGEPVRARIEDENEV